MGRVTCHISISLDGFVAGPDQSPDEPLGVGGERLHDWAFADAVWRAEHGFEGGETGVDSEVSRRVTENVGAYIMGRNMFASGRGDWDLDWRGWWGDDPPFHAPVYVLTHYERDPLEMDGGTTFHFVTDGIESALEQARAAAGDGDVAIAGGAECVRQYIRAGLLDELLLHVSPLLLGGGERLLEDVGEAKFEIAETIASDLTTHVRYRLSY